MKALATAAPKRLAELPDVPTLTELGYAGIGTNAWQGMFAPAAVSFDVDNMRKDLRAMVAEARALGRTLPVAERTLECFDQASREGLGASDCSMLPVHWLRSRAR